MATLIVFFLKSLFVSGLLYLNYWIALRNKQLHQYNRFYLLLALVMPVILPLMNIKLYDFKLHIPARVNNFSTEIFSNNPAPPHSLFTFGYIVFAIVIIVCIVMLFTLLSGVVDIYKIKNSHVIKRMDGYNLIETDLKQAPFCFLNNLFWRKSISVSDNNGKKILTHELAHIREGHTYDKLFSQVILCFLWINPFYWFVQKELNIIHEFIADSKSIKDGDTESFAKMLLQSHNEGRHLNPSYSFFHSSIKRRLIMITMSKNTRYSYLRRVLVLPITLLTFVVFSCTKTSPETTLVSTEMDVNKGSTITTMTNVQFKKEDGISSKIMPVKCSVGESNNDRKKINSNYSTITTNVTFTKKDGAIGNIIAPVVYTVAVAHSEE